MSASPPHSEISVISLVREDCPSLSGVDSNFFPVYGEKITLRNIQPLDSGKVQYTFLTPGEVDKQIIMSR